jgi:hypothetical protein
MALSKEPTARHHQHRHKQPGQRNQHQARPYLFGAIPLHCHLLLHALAAVPGSAALEVPRAGRPGLPHNVEGTKGRQAQRIACPCVGVAAAYCVHVHSVERILAPHDVQHLW